MNKPKKNLYVILNLVLNSVQYLFQDFRVIPHPEGILEYKQHFQFHPGALLRDETQHKKTSSAAEQRKKKNNRNYVILKPTTPK